MAELNHLLVRGFTESQTFKSRGQGPRPESPQRARGEHGAALLRQLERLRLSAEELAQQRAVIGLDEAAGMTIALQFAQNSSYDFKSLEWVKDGVEVLSVVDSGAGPVVALHVPDGKLGALERRVREYLDKDNKSGTPRNAALVNAIEAIRHAAFDELWTDDAPSPAETPSPSWFQLWLRVGRKTASEVVADFLRMAGGFSIAVEPGFVSFPGRVVVAVLCTRSALEQAASLLDVIAEIRAVQPNAEFFLSNLTPREQANWLQDLRRRCSFSLPDSGPYVTLMDTGVNRAHLLLQDAIAEDDVIAVLPEWGGADADGHGTEMAGILCHGDLAGPLAHGDELQIPHRLESVKIFPPNGSNPRHLYGWVVAQAVDNVERRYPLRQRVFATMTTAIGPGAGKPSEWSATVDQLAFGLNGLMPYSAGVNWSEAILKPRLFVLSAGNVPWQGWSDYPVINHRTSIEDPGQAWNALTVGACTHHIDVDRDRWPDAAIIAQEGSLAPASTTSLLWAHAWPIKPDIVAEGGNGTLNPAPHVSVGPESLRILTTSHQQHVAPFAESGDTSGAAAEVGRICAHLRARYPQYWEETVRALVVHGARFTPRMRSQLPRNYDKSDVKNLLRTYGYGKASLENSLFSDRLEPTLVVQESIVPFLMEKGKVKFNEMNLHELPWPKEVLRDLGETLVEMRVTLSYFIEPNPSRRGWQSKFRYQSHGLRFAVKGASETADRFNYRVNELEREAAELDSDESLGDPDRDSWEIGAKLRARGSLHSDVWSGTAVSLADKSHVAVFPVGGWWRDWNGSGRAEVAVRYALIVSIRPLQDVSAEIDLYTPIKTQIAIANGITIDEV